MIKKGVKKTEEYAIVTDKEARCVWLNEDGEKVYKHKGEWKRVNDNRFGNGSEYGHGRR